MLVSKALEI
jgi:hypothetical protein